MKRKLFTIFALLPILGQQISIPTVSAKSTPHQRMVQIIAPIEDTDYTLIRTKLANTKIHLMYGSNFWEIPLAVDDASTVIEVQKFWKLKSGRLVKQLSAKKPVPSAESVEHAVLSIPAKSITDILEKTIAPLVDKAPSGVKIIKTKDRVVFEDVSTDGQKINTAATMRAIITAFEQGQKSTKLVIDSLPASGPEAGARVQLVGFDGVKVEQLIGIGVSDFSKSPRNRRQNIRVGLEKMDGVLVRQGENFSFNSHLGPVDARHGFLKELVIQDGDVTPEYGGGLCQVSTTVFRAAMKSGLPIVERKNHSLAVRYYNGPDEWDWWGSDATTYAPSLDLKFKNDTPGDIIIHTEINGDRAYVFFYGVSDGRRVEINNQKISGGKSGANRAFTASFDYTVKMPDGTVREKTFTSRYSKPKKPH